MSIAPHDDPILHVINIIKIRCATSDASCTSLKRKKKQIFKFLFFVFLKTKLKTYESF